LKNNVVASIKELIKESINNNLKSEINEINNKIKIEIEGLKEKIEITNKKLENNINDQFSLANKEKNNENEINHNDSNKNDHKGNILQMPKKLNVASHLNDHHKPYNKNDHKSQNQKNTNTSINKYKSNKKTEKKNFNLNKNDNKSRQKTVSPFLSANFDSMEDDDMLEEPSNIKKNTNVNHAALIPDDDEFVDP
jgi:hypothetical protein